MNASLELEIKLLHEFREIVSDLNASWHALIKNFKIKSLGMILLKESKLLDRVKKILSSIKRRRNDSPKNPVILGLIKEAIDLFNVAYLNIQGYSGEHVDYSILRNILEQLWSLLPEGESWQPSLVWVEENEVPTVTRSINYAIKDDPAFTNVSLPLGGDKFKKLVSLSLDYIRQLAAKCGIVHLQATQVELATHLQYIPVSAMGRDWMNAYS